MSGIIGLLNNLKTAAFSTVVSVDTDKKQFKFLSVEGKDKNSAVMTEKSYRVKPFGDEFYERFTQCLREYAQEKPEYVGKTAAVTVVLPDYLVATDRVKVPGMKKNQEMLSLAVDSKYKNRKELRVNSFPLAANKQHFTYGLTIMREELLRSVRAACLAGNVYVDKITFAANTLGNAVLSLNPKLKNTSFIVLDIKEDTSRYAFVNKGFVTGAYALPFGAKILRSEKLVAENMLFDYSTAELTVLNAKEKAKAKALTMMDGDVTSLVAEQEEDPFSSTDSTVNVQSQPQIKTLPRKTARVLPKFMQRAVPDDREGRIYENFRHFIKWTLDLIVANDCLASVAPFDAVHVNMPVEFAYLIDRANEEAEENKIRFALSGLEKEKAVISENPELFGGIFVKQFNRQNNF